MQQGNTTNHLVGAALEVGSGLLLKIKPLAKAYKAVSTFAGKVGIGGVTQDRFLERRDKILNLFKQYGYGNNLNGATFAKVYKVLAADIPNRLTDRTYKNEFDRLYEMTRARLNANNPGLGDLYATYVPSFKMANKGNMYSEPIKILEIFLKEFKPGKYQPGQLPPDVTPDNKVQTLLPDNSVPASAGSGPLLAGMPALKLDNPWVIGGIVVTLGLLVYVGMKKV